MWKLFQPRGSKLVKRSTKHFLTSANQRCVFLYIPIMCMLGLNVRVSSRSAIMYTLNFKALFFCSFAVALVKKKSCMRILGCFNLILPYNLLF